MEQRAPRHPPRTHHRRHPPPRPSPKPGGPAQTQPSNGAALQDPGTEDVQLTALGDRTAGSDAPNPIGVFDVGDPERGGRGGLSAVNAGLGDDAVGGGLEGYALDGGGLANVRAGLDGRSHAGAAGPAAVGVIAGTAADGAAPMLSPTPGR